MGTLDPKLIRALEGSERGSRYLASAMGMFHST